MAKYVLENKFIGLVLGGANTASVFSGNKINSGGAATLTSAPSSNLGDVYSIGSYLNQVTIEQQSNRIDVSTFGTGKFAEYLQGEITWSASISGYRDNDLNKDVLNLINYIALSPSITDKRIGLIIAPSGDVNTTSGLPNLETPVGQEIFFGIVTPESVTPVNATYNQPDQFTISLTGNRQLAQGRPATAWDVSHANHIFDPAATGDNITSTA